MKARPDDWAGYANLGTFYMEQREFQKAADCFETATRLEPRMVGPMVNASMAYSNLRQNDKAESSLRRALEAEPNNAAALFNLGLLLAEERRMQEAEKALRAAVKADPQMAAAAFNLGVLCGKARIDEAVQWCQKAHELEPGNAKYAHTLAFFLREKGELDRAIEVLRDLIGRHKFELDAYLLLGEIYEDQGDKKEAAAVYRRLSALPNLSPAVRRQIQAQITRLGEGRGSSTIQRPTAPIPRWGSRTRMGGDCPDFFLLLRTASGGTRTGMSSSADTEFWYRPQRGGAAVSCLWLAAPLVDLRLQLVDLRQQCANNRLGFGRLAEMNMRLPP